MIKKILIVDDEETIVVAAKTALEVYGYEVETASSGFESLEKLENIDIVLLDIKMPEMNGIETLKEIKKRKPKLPVIMITAYATVDTAIEAMKCGAADYVRKPFNVDELEKGILAAIEDVKFTYVENAYTENCFERFEKLTKHARGICIARSFEKIKIHKNVTCIPMEHELKPRSIEDIKADVEQTISKNDAVLLANIEYLFKANDAEHVREFLEWMNKKVLNSNGKLILSAHLTSIKEKERHALQDIIADIHLGLFSDSISNYIRRRIINLLYNGGKLSFTRIAQELKIKDNPKLSFHLKKLKDDGMLEQDEEKKYFLSPMGRDIAVFIENIKKDKLKKSGDILWMPSR